MANRFLRLLRSYFDTVFTPRGDHSTIRIAVMVSLMFLGGACSATIATNPGNDLSIDPIPQGSMWARYKYTNSVTEAENTYRKGKAASHAFFGMIAYGDSSISAAMADGKITKIKHVDSRVYSVSAPCILISIYKEHVTFVYGE